MADRTRSTAASSSGNEHRGPSTTSAVRRNLFQGQLTRRPTAGTGSSSHAADALRLDADVRSDTSEIVVRDQHGEIDLGDPPTPVLEEPEDLPLDDQQEHEKERQRLAEAVKHHQINHTAVRDQPEELLEAVRASLRAKVAALAEDNWMFEPEEPTHA